MNALAAAGALFVATIGSWISIVGFGTTSLPCLPAAKAAYASLSYVMRTSPWPAKNAFAAFEPDEGCATTFLNSFVTNFIGLLVVQARLARLAVGRENVPLRRSGRERIRGHDLDARLGEVLPRVDVLRVARPHDEGDDRVGRDPALRCVRPVLGDEPASATVSMSRPVERNAMSAGWPAAIALACAPDGPYDW